MNDFFDTNPPLVFYLLVPPHLFSHLFSIGLINAYRIYILLLSIGSLLACSFLLQKIFLKQDRFLVHFLSLGLACTFVLFPLGDFGQREHILFILTIPYILTAVCRFQGQILPSAFLVGVGVFAAFGFALKPFFLLTIVGIEIYGMWYTRCKYSWISIDVISIFTCLLLYFFLILVRHSHYIEIAVPILRDFYYSGFSNTWYEMFASPSLIFCGLAMIFILKDKDNYPVFCSILLITLITFIFAYALQHTSWHYHLLPAESMAWILAIFSLSLFIQKHKNNSMLVVLSILILFLLPVLQLQKRYTYALSFKDNIAPFIEFLQSLSKNQPIYVISADVKPIFPSVSYANSLFASRFEHTFWIPGSVKNQLSNNKNPAPQSLKEQFLIHLMCEDILTKKPKYILVDMTMHKAFWGSINFEYLTYLFKNSEFKTAMQPYVYVKNIQSRRKNSLALSQKWQFYWAAPKHQIIPKEIDGHAVVFTGEGRNLSAYYIQNNTFLQDQFGIYHTNLVLNDDELAKFPKHIDQKYTLLKEDKALSGLFERSVSWPIFNYAVFMRHDSDIKANT